MQSVIFVIITPITNTPGILDMTSKVFHKSIQHVVLGLYFLSWPFYVEPLVEIIEVHEISLVIEKSSA